MTVLVSGMGCEVAILAQIDGDRVCHGAIVIGHYAIARIKQIKDRIVNAALRSSERRHPSKGGVGITAVKSHRRRSDRAKVVPGP